MVAFAAFVSSSASAAQEAIIITASRTESSEALGGTTLSRTDIERTQPITALDPLNRIAGVRAFSKGGAGGGTYLSVRGGEPNFTLILLNGIKLNDPTNSQGGAFDFAQIDPYALERIEVARGALSAVHGSDALSGVVNLQLRNVAEGERLLATRVFADTQGGVGLNGTTGTGWAGGNLLASGSWFDSGNLTEDSELQRWQAFGRASQKIGNFTLAALALHARSDRTAFPEDSGGPRLAILRERERRDTRLTVASLELIRSDPVRVQPRLALNWTRQRASADTPPIAPGVVDGVPGIIADSRFVRAEILADVRVRPWETLAAAAGGGYIYEDGRGRGAIDLGFPLPADFDIDRSIASGFVELTFAPDEQFSATAALRHDKPSSRRSEWTGRASARFKPLRQGPALYASLSEGYKLPSLYALAYPIIANPTLQPERGRSFELGIEQPLGTNGRLRTAYFHNRFIDLIDFDAAQFTNVNRARVTAEGIEAEVESRIAPGVRLEGALTYIDVDNEPGAPPLRSRPKWQGALAVDWQATERLLLSFTGAFNTDYFDSSVPTGLIEQEGHVEFGATANYHLTNDFTLSLTGRNLLSAEYEDAVGFPATGRLVRLSVGARF